MDEPAPAVIVVGASAGGVEALTTLAGGLPEDLDAAVCVVLHLPAAAESRLAHILSRAGPLPATQARGGEALRRGHVYVAPPGRRQRLRDPIRRVLTGSAVDELELDGHDPRGKPVRVQVAVAPLQNRPDAEEPDGAILPVTAKAGRA
ncbi:MAG TPA: chemotaxis protein CheB [Gaiellaceae bacterium]|nr:chemotaxis protein CheB [Gaiellaceae bacterium]